MKNQYILMGFLLFLLSMGAHAVGSPMNEDFTHLVDLSNQAIEVGKTGDTQAFIDSVNVVRKALSEQGETGSSIGLQRANAKLKAAVKAAKAGDLPKGIAAVEQGIEIMKIKK
jgi:hypothetical protein